MEVPLCLAQERYANLLSLIPQYKESYESVDAAGATTRRFAIVCDDDHQLTALAASPPTTSPAANVPSIPAGELQGAMRWMSRRFAATGFMLQSSTGRLKLTLNCHPTDPLWRPPGSPLHLQLTVYPARYEQRCPGSLLVECVHGGSTLAEVGDGAPHCWRALQPCTTLWATLWMHRVARGQWHWRRRCSSMPIRCWSQKNSLRGCSGANALRWCPRWYALLLLVYEESEWGEKIRKTGALGAAG